MRVFACVRVIWIKWQPPRIGDSQGQIVGLGNGALSLMWIDVLYKRPHDDVMG